MRNNSELKICQILNEIIEVLRDQAKGLEMLTDEVAQTTAHLQEKKHFSLVGSQLAGLQLQVLNVMQEIGYEKEQVL